MSSFCVVKCWFCWYPNDLPDPPQITPRPQLPPLPKHSFWEVLLSAAFTLEDFFRLCAEIRRLKPTKTWMTINVGWLTFNRQTNSENYHVNMLMKLCNRGFSWFSNRRANEPKVGSGSQFFHPTWGEDCQNHYVIMMGPSHPMWVHPQVTIALCQQRSPLAQVPSFQLPQLPPVGGPTKFHPISIREGQKKHVRTCIHTYIVRVYYIYIYLYTMIHMSRSHIYIYM